MLGLLATIPLIFRDISLIRTILPALTFAHRLFYSPISVYGMHSKQNLSGPEPLAVSGYISAWRVKDIRHAVAKNVYLFTRTFAPNSEASRLFILLFNNFMEPIDFASSVHLFQFFPLLPSL